jgi:hypothetical protein
VTTTWAIASQLQRLVFLEVGRPCVVKPPTLVGDLSLGPFIWTAMDPIPRGLSLSQSGEIGGIPIDQGVFAVTLRAIDAQGAFDETEIKIVVGEIGTRDWVGIRFRLAIAEARASARRDDDGI